MVAVPVATPVTKPADDTFATAALLDVKMTVGEVTICPLASVTIADKGVDTPTASVSVDGVRVTDPVPAAATVTVAVPTFPSMVPVILAVPAAIPLTTPAVETVAMLGLADAHVTTRSLRTLPLASVGEADSGDVVPTPIVTVFGDMVTASTANEALVTVTVDVPDCPVALVAVTVDEPVATPVIVPVGETVTIFGSLEVQVNVVLTEVPSLSRAVTVSGAVEPTDSVTSPGRTDTVATAPAPDDAGTTVIVCVANFPCVAASIVIVPGLTPVMTPVLLIVAIDSSGERNSTTQVDASECPSLSSGVAISCTAWPT
jgi:hypothetical protein